MLSGFTKGPIKAMKNGYSNQTIRPTKLLNIHQDSFTYALALFAIALQVCKNFYYPFSCHNFKCSNHAWKEQKRVDLNIILGKLSTLSGQRRIWHQSKNDCRTSTIMKFISI